MVKSYYEDSAERAKASGQVQGMLSFFLFSEGLFSYIPLLEF